MSEQSKKNSRSPRPQQGDKTRGKGDRPSRPGKPAENGADRAERRRSGNDKAGGHGGHGDATGNDRSRGGRPAGSGKGGMSGGTGADRKRPGKPAHGGKRDETGRDDRNRSDNRRDSRRDDRSDSRRDDRSDNRRDNAPDNRSDNRRDSRPDSRRENRRDDRSDNRRDSRRDNAPDSRSDNRRDGRPDSRRENRRDDRSDNRRDSRRDNRTDGRQPDSRGHGGKEQDRLSGKSWKEHAPARTPHEARDVRAPRRDGAYGTAWQGAEALFPHLTEEARHILEQLPQALSRVWPLSKAHRRTLPDDVAGLSRLLTTERAALDRPYWSSPAFVSAYLYYFLPWNLVRLTRLLSAMPLPDPHAAAPQGGRALLLDVGSGPLTLPLALWLARPQWRQAPIQVLALDNSSQPLDLGRALFEELAGLTFHEPWAVHTARGQMEHAARHAAPLLAGGQARPWLVSAANVLNELRFGKRSGRGSSLEERLGMLEDDAPEDFGSADYLADTDDEFSEGGHVLRPGRLHGRGDVEGERPEDCRQEKLVRFLDSLAPLFHSRYAAPQGPALLFVEPGTRLGGSTIMDLRQLAVEGGLTALAPCPHQAACPLSDGQGGRTWCHFTFGSEGAPRWLEELSADSGLAKSGLSLAPLLLAPVAPAEAARMAPEGPHGGGKRPRSGVMKARVLTAPFAVPGLAGRGRYACSACGLLLLEDADGLPSGHALDVNVPADAARDGKSGARIVRRPGSSASGQGPRYAQGRHERGGRKA